MLVDLKHADAVIRFGRSMDDEMNRREAEQYLRTLEKYSSRQFFSQMEQKLKQRPGSSPYDYEQADINSIARNVMQMAQRGQIPTTWGKKAERLGNIYFDEIKRLSQKYAK